VRSHGASRSGKTDAASASCQNVDDQINLDDASLFFQNIVSRCGSAWNVFVSALLQFATKKQAQDMTVGSTCSSAMSWAV
jgi:hypothetical protein